MSELARIDIERARFEPDAVFAHPLDVVGDAILTRGQKLATLARWAHLVRDQLRATEEGMPQPVGQSKDDAVMLESIEHARLSLLDQPPLQ